MIAPAIGYGLCADAAIAPEGGHRAGREGASRGREILACPEVPHMPIPDVPRAVAHGRLAKAVQAGRPADQIERLRAEYHACAARDRILEVAPRLLPEHRAELAGLLVGGGDDVAA